MRCASIPNSRVARIMVSSSCSNVPANVAAMFGEIENRVADDLAGAVIGDVAAAVGGMEFDIHLPKDAICGA